MVRLPRIAPTDIPIHIIQRGNNRQVCFGSDDDHAAYAGWLKEYSKKYKVDVHAWVIMTNHVHLLCTPRHEKGISSMMQALDRRYVRYFNYQHKRSGILWEGRYKSCLVESKIYLLNVHRYIELNPVRAGMVLSPGIIDGPEPAPGRFVGVETFVRLFNAFYFLYLLRKRVLSPFSSLFGISFSGKQALYGEGC